MSNQTSMHRRLYLVDGKIDSSVGYYAENISKVSTEETAWPFALEHDPGAVGYAAEFASLAQRQSRLQHLTQITKRRSCEKSGCVKANVEQ